MQKFTVLRDHLGDRAYRAGDIREAPAHEVSHLVGAVLQPMENKAEAAPENKATPAAMPRTKPVRGN